MYLCIGSFLKLITLYKKSRYGLANEEICNELFAFSDSIYSKKDASYLLTCTTNLKRNDWKIIKSYDVSKPSKKAKLYEILEDAINYILTDVLISDNVGPFVYSILKIMESDETIENDKHFGINPEYTKRNVLKNFNTFDIKEFLMNIFYYCLTLKDNKSGNDTVVNCLTESFVKEQSFAASNVFIVKRDNESRYSYRKSISDNELPVELTNTPVIAGTSQTVLFRENEFQQVVNLIKDDNAKSIFLHGMGGCGKTSLARMLYCHLKDSYDCYGWINYSGDLKQSMIDAIIDDEYNDESMAENDSQKKWIHIQRKLTNSMKKKLFVIDNVDFIDQIQDPRCDKDLVAMSSWNNTTIIITSRLSSIPGYTSHKLEVTNLGDETKNTNCIELFYHYNEKAYNNRKNNRNVVANLCKLAGYNTMVIELLAKGSYYYGDDLDEFYQELVTNNFSCANDTQVATDHDFNVIKTNNNIDYYDIGNETVASQLYKLFNLKTRSQLEQLILWDFHCLRENEKISRSELKNWMGYSPKDFGILLDEGWIKFQDGFFFIHPLVNQSISCAQESSKFYWNIKQHLIFENKYSNDILSLLPDNAFFKEDDSFDMSHRKLIFVDCLTYHGDFLDATDWINIADVARRKGNLRLGVYYYQKAYAYYDSLNNLDESKYISYWKCTYFYGYMLSYTRVGYEEAEALLSKSLNIAEEIVGKYGSSNDNLMLLATSFDHLGYILSNSLNNDIERITKADFYLNEAVKLRQMLCAAVPAHFRLLHDYAWSLDNLGAFYININIEQVAFSTNFDTADIEYLTKDEIINRKKETETILKEALDIRITLSVARNDADSTEVAWTYFNLASLLYSSIIKMNKELTGSVPDYFKLAELQSKVQKAENYIKEALLIYNRLDQRFPGQHMSSEARTTALYGRLLKLIPNRKSESKELIERAVKLYTLLDTENPGRYKKELIALIKER